MANDKGWNEYELKVLEDAVDFHGQLSDRVIDDLADTLRKSPQAVKSMARRIRTRLRKEIYTKDDSQATVGNTTVPTTMGATGSIGLATDEAVADKPLDHPMPVIKRRRSNTATATAPSPETADVPATGNAPEAPARARGTKPYTELVKALEELEALCAEAKKARTRAEAANKALNEAETRIRAKQAEVQKAFPAARSLVEVTLGRYN